MSEPLPPLEQIRRMLARVVQLSGLTISELSALTGIAERRLEHEIAGPGPLDLELLLAVLETLRVAPLQFFSLALDEGGGEGFLHRLLAAVSETLDHERRESFERHLEEELDDEAIPRTTDRELQLLLRRLVRELSEE